LRRLTFGRRGVLLRRPGLQWAGGQRPVSSGLLAGPVDLEPTPQRATHDAEVLGDAADRGARGGLVQVDGLTTELLGIVLPSHDSRIISLPQHHVLDSACPRTGVRPPATSATLRQQSSSRSSTLPSRAARPWLESNNQSLHQTQCGSDSRPRQRSRSAWVMSPRASVPDTPAAIARPVIVAAKPWASARRTTSFGTAPHRAAARRLTPITAAVRLGMSVVASSTAV